ncbi:hypothetical protein SAMN05660284_00069 [Formivibrio citricus]|uniref:Uncharacterized protein n=1 Tax=Formivibrio citricus TaxID=83765 RepID=A0A1I4V0V4_9NEIS|nr:hypothetical protein [Formivibrio citricus]SFM94812.1 hypothetical protein SAMN05660284_00069 [Formivibrio citricus]
MKTESIQPLVWEYEVPLFSREMQMTWLKAMLATALIMVGLFVVIMGSGGHWRALGGIVSMLLAVVGGLYVLGLLVMLLVFRGHNRMRFTLDADGILCEIIDRTVKRSNRLAVLLGTILMEPRLLGAGLLSTAAESTRVAWSGRFIVEADPRRRILRLKNGWRTLLWVYCTPENYAAVAQIVQEQTSRTGSARRLPARPPLPGYLLRTAGVVLACLPLFLMSKEFRTTLFMPIFTLCFALATLWLIHIFGYVVLGGLLVQWFQTGTRLLEVRRSWLRPGKTYQAWEVLGGDDISLLVLGGVATLALGIYAWRAVRGRCPAVLARDQADMDGDE